MWIYVQSTGRLYFSGVPVGTGYSGYGEGKNSPAYEAIKSVGPIPAGRWRIQGEPFDSPNTGPFCLRLAPCHGTDTHGRSAFLVHGDSLSAPGTASHGCIILARPLRRAMWESADTDLLVIAEEPLPTLDDLGA